MDHEATGKWYRQHIGHSDGTVLSGGISEHPPSEARRNWKQPKPVGPLQGRTQCIQFPFLKPGSKSLGPLLKTSDRNVEKRKVKK